MPKFTLDNSFRFGSRRETVTIFHSESIDTILKKLTKDWLAQFARGEQIELLGLGKKSGGKSRNVRRAKIRKLPPDDDAIDKFDSTAVSKVKDVNAKFQDIASAIDLLGSKECSAGSVVSSRNVRQRVPTTPSEKAESALRAHSSSVRGSTRQAKIPEETVREPKKLQPYIKEEVLVGICNGVFPCTAEQFFTLLFSDDSNFTNEYRAARKDNNLVDLHTLELRLIRGIITNAELVVLSMTYRTKGTSKTNIWRKRRYVFSDIALGTLFVQQAHDIPFGSIFEIHCRWHLETVAENSSAIDIKVGAHFKKWCVMQSKIKTGAVNVYQKEVEVMLEIARSYIKTQTSCGETNNQSRSLSITPDFKLAIASVSDPVIDVVVARSYIKTHTSCGETNNQSHSPSIFPIFVGLPDTLHLLMFAV
ncbi:hypothetical protein CUMW_084430 [Citrus unshiu]|nr:hypothetical protein CUMW_084430 [Citrus unshiu]